MKKLFTFLVVICVFLFACASMDLNKSDTREAKFGPVSYTMPLTIPDFTSWQGDVYPIFTSQRLSVIRWFGTNPNNSDECVIVLIAGENQKQGYFMVLAYMPSILNKKQYFYVDKQYFITGKPSFVLSSVNGPPDVEQFISMKQLQLTPKAEI